jgi:hypothetical protein
MEDHESMTMDVIQMEPDDDMSWDDSAAEDMQAQSTQKKEQQMSLTPDMLWPGASPQKSPQRLQQQQSVVQQLQQQELIITQQRQQ